MRFLSRLLLVSSILPVIMFSRWDVAEATDSLYNFSVAETRELFGDSLTVKLFSNGQYQEFTAEYVETVTCDSWSNFNGWGRVFDNKQWLRYYISDNVAVGNDPAFIQVDFSPVGTITDTKNFVFAVGVGNGSSRVSTVSDVYSTSVWQYKINGQQDYGYCPEAVNGVYPYAKYPLGGSTYSMTVCPIDLSLSASGTLVTGRACFYGTTSRNILVRCPTVDYDASFSPGDTSEGGSDSDQIDLSETNGLLGTINGWLSSIAGLISNISDTVVDGIKGLFVPDDGFFDTWQGSISSMFSEHFGGVVEAFHIAEDVFSQFDDVVASETIHFDGISWNSGQGVFKIPEADIPLKPASDKLGVLYTALAAIIDIICTVAFINMLRKRGERVLGGGNDI